VIDDRPFIVEELAPAAPPFEVDGAAGEAEFAPEAGFAGVPTCC